MRRVFSFESTSTLIKDVGFISGYLNYANFEVIAKVILKELVNDK